MTHQKGLITRIDFYRAEFSGQTLRSKLIDYLNLTQ